MSISREITYGHDFAAEAEKLKADWGRTTLFSTGVPGLDEYLGGGFGRANAYELLLIFAPTKQGKSTVALNFAADAIKKGKRVGVIAVEDDGPDVLLRLCRIVGEEAAKKYVLQGTTVHFLSPSVMDKMWKLPEVLVLIEEWFTERELDLIIVDPIQMIFENSESIKGETEYANQRVFVRGLNGVLRRVKKTLILVSHTNKDTYAKGVNKILGSGGIAAASTKILELSKVDGVLQIQEWGSRFTRTPDEPYQIMLDNLKLKSWDGRVQS